MRGSAAGNLTLLVMSRVWPMLLSATLILWWPVSFTVEFFSALASLGQRGPVAVIELAVHAAVAVAAVAAVRALSIGLPSALLLCRVALVCSPLATIQSFYWSLLPHQTMPGDKLPLAATGVVVSVLWLIFLGRRGSA